MKKSISFALAAAVLIAGTAFYVSRTPVSRAQTISLDQASQQLTILSSAVTTFTAVEAQRRALLASVAANLGSLVTSTQALVSMPTSTDAERAVISQRISAISTELAMLTPLVSALNEIRSREIAILGILAARLATLNAQLR